MAGGAKRHEQRLRSKSRPLAIIQRNKNPTSCTYRQGSVVHKLKKTHMHAHARQGPRTQQSCGKKKRKMVAVPVGGMQYNVTQEWREDGRPVKPLACHLLRGAQLQQHTPLGMDTMKITHGCNDAASITHCNTRQGMWLGGGISARHTMLCPCKQHSCCSVHESCGTCAFF